MLLSIEAVTIALVVAVVILVRLAAGGAPQDRTVGLSVFTIPAGADVSAVFLGVVFGFLSFVGF